MSGQAKSPGIMKWLPRRGYFIGYQVCSGQGMVFGDEKVASKILVAQERFHCIKIRG